MNRAERIAERVATEVNVWAASRLARVVVSEYDPNARMITLTGEGYGAEQLIIMVHPALGGRVDTATTIKYHSTTGAKGRKITRAHARRIIAAMEEAEGKRIARDMAQTAEGLSPGEVKPITGPKDRYGRVIPAGCKDVKLSLTGAWRTTYTHIVAGDVVRIQQDTASWEPNGLRYAAAGTQALARSYWVNVASVERVGRMVRIMLVGGSFTEDFPHAAITRKERETEYQARIGTDASARAASIAESAVPAVTVVPVICTPVNECAECLSGTICIDRCPTCNGTNSRPCKTHDTVSALVTGHPAESHSRRGSQCRICKLPVVDHADVNVNDPVAVSQWTGTAWGSTVNPERVAAVADRRVNAREAAIEADNARLHAADADSFLADAYAKLPLTSLPWSCMVHGDKFATMQELDAHIDAHLEYRAQDAATIAAKSLFTGDTSDVDAGVEALVAMLPGVSGWQTAADLASLPPVTDQVASIRRTLTEDAHRDAWHRLIDSLPGTAERERSCAAMDAADRALGTVRGEEWYAVAMEVYRALGTAWTARNGKRKASKRKEH